MPGDSLETKHMKPMRWMALAVAAGGAALIGLSGRLPHAWVDRAADLLAGKHVQADWYLLIGFIVAVGGGLFAQLMIEEHHAA